MRNGEFHGHNRLLGELHHIGALVPHNRSVILGNFMKRFVLALLSLGMLLFLFGCASAEKSKPSSAPAPQPVDLGRADTQPGKSGGEREEIWDDYNKVMEESEQMR